MNMIGKTTLLTVVAAVSVGCGTNGKYGGHNKATKNSYSYEDAVASIEEGVAVEIASIFLKGESEINRVISRNNPGFRLNIDTKIKPISGTGNVSEINASFSLVGTYENIVIFEPGEYTVDDVKGKVFMTAITSMVDEAVKMYGNEYDLLVLADYIGSSDGVPVGDNLYYEGEMGDIYISADDLMVDGDKPNVSFVKTIGEPIYSNSELAIIRSYGIYSALKKSAGSKKIEHLFDVSKYIAKTNPASGYTKNQRYAEVMIRIKKRRSGVRVQS